MINLTFFITIYQPYNDQDQKVIQVEVQNLQGQSIGIKDPIYSEFEPKGDLELQTCISRGKNGWDTDTCETGLSERDLLSGPKVQCQCKNFQPTTVVTDISSLFRSSKLTEIFTENAIVALSQIKFYKLIIFYVLLGKVIIYFILLHYTRKMDLNQFKVNDLVIVN